MGEVEAVDPAAEFLAQQQDDLQDLENELGAEVVQNGVENHEGGDFLNGGMEMVTDTKELEDWDRNRAEQLAKTKENNRSAEEEFVKDRDNVVPGSEWERVTKLCDFNPKATRGGKDLSRMRQCLLFLNQIPRPITNSLPTQ